MKSINWKLRFQNPATCLALIGAIIAFIYQILGILGIVPSIAKETWIELAGIIVNILAGLGILVDPTTSGVSDSVQAQGYDSPKKIRYSDESEMAAVYGLNIKETSSKASEETEEGDE